MYSIKLDLVFEKSEMRCQIQVHSKKLVCKKKFTQRSKEVNLEEQNHCPKSKRSKFGVKLFCGHLYAKQTPSLLLFGSHGAWVQVRATPRKQ